MLNLRTADQALIGAAASSLAGMLAAELGVYA
jgi:hypothetical protein